MRKIFFALLLVFTVAVAKSQCSCKENLLFVIDKIEQNYAGFHDKVTTSTETYYTALKDSLLTAADAATGFNSACQDLVNTYIRFFKDGHMYMYHEPVPVHLDEDSIRRSYQKWPKENFTAQSFTAYLKTKKGRRSPEGIWMDASGSYKLGLVEKKDRYNAFIIKADSLYWMPQQLKFIIYPQQKGYKAIYYKRDHSADSIAVNFKNDALTVLQTGEYGTWYKINPATGKPYATPRNQEEDGVVYFKKLSAKTNLLTIKSFESNYINLIDSVVNANDDIIRTTPYLIIDVRNNGGGADAGYRTLKKYLYTNPYQFIGTDLYCSEDNIQNFRTYAANTDFSADDRKEFTRIADSMAAHKNGFWSPWATFNEEKMDTVLPVPVKIAVLINEHCGSTTEQFLLDPVKNSRKAIIMGRHSSGVLDYANMNFLPMPCKGHEIGYATSRTRRIPLGKGIDNKGIQPDIVLDDAVQNWVVFAQQYLEK